MRLPVDWIGEYVQNDLSVRELAFILTNVGLEVEAIEEANGAAVFDIKVTPNRGDCLSVVGVARELAMRLRKELVEPRPAVVETGPPASSLVRVTLDDPALCPRYSARVVRNVKIGSSPAWARRRLELCGLRPINNIVDATNLVMLELGQPLHAFDRQLVAKAAGQDVPEIVVRLARPGERLVTIDAEDRSPTPDILLITDSSGPIALAGIMGGASSEIHDGTTDVLLESAHFDPGVIRRGARALGMSTEASYRFERTVDPGGTVRALDRACELIAEFCEAPVEVAAGVVDAYPMPIAEREIELRPARAKALLGIDLSAADIAAALGWLALEVRGSDPLVVRAPTFRRDLTTEVDLVEELARVHGYEDIPETLPRGGVGVGALPPELAFEMELRHLLRGMGLTESVSSSLESPDAHGRLGLAEEDPLRRAVGLANWKTADRTQLRTTLLTSLLEIVSYNRRHGVEQVSLFDLGRVYLPGAAGELPAQPQHLGIAVTGPMTRGQWAVPPEVARWDFFALKGIIENAVEATLGVAAEFAPLSHPALRPGRAAEVSVGGPAIGLLGEVSAETRESYDLPDPVLVAELDLDALRSRRAPDVGYRPVSRFPAVRRDVAFLVARDVAAERARQVIEETVGDDIESIALFDAFEGKPLPEGVRNLAFSLVFRRADRTLTDEEVDGDMERVRAALRGRLRAQIRE